MFMPTQSGCNRLSEGRGADAVARISGQIEDAIAVKCRMAADSVLLATIEQAAELCMRSRERGRRILFAGNGGSAADVQQLAAKLVGRFVLDGSALAEQATTTNTATYRHEVGYIALGQVSSGLAEHTVFGGGGMNAAS